MRTLIRGTAHGPIILAKGFYGHRIIKKKSEFCKDSARFQSFTVTSEPGLIDIVFLLSVFSCVIAPVQ
ncbi:hypothetical protein YERSI8AC_100210 [Enterobacterales bacterium 8AC]|jgi:hypothetical protein|nr:hypothetical protein YERSI8AC_100210 [Enterobacterales bacterium 8AC]